MNPAFNNTTRHPMQPPPGFTRHLPENYDTSPDWYFVWHSPDPTATTSGHAWDADGKYYTKTSPDDARRRGSGQPVPATRLGFYARLNSEGQHWSWMPMPAFVQLVEGGSSDASLQAKVVSLEAELKALRGGLMIVHGEVARLVGEVGQ